MKRNQLIVAAVVFAVLFLLSVLLFALAPANTYFTQFGKILQEKELIPDVAKLSVLELLCCISIALISSMIAWKLCEGKKLETVLPIAVFILVLYIPLLFGWGSDFALSDTENRTMAQKPVYAETELKEYPAKMDSYLADHVPFRKIWLRFSGLVKYGVFNSSYNKLSMPGKDGWIYYGGTGYSTGEDPVADYRKTNLFSDEELANLAKSLQGFKNFLDSQGIEFRLMINPNKSHVYPEYLPDWLVEGEGMTRAEQLKEYLRNHTNVEIVYPKEALLEAKKEYLIYVPTDSHWNTVGGYVGFVELMKSLDSSFVAPSIAEINPVYYCKDLADVSNIVNAAWFTDNVWTQTSYKPEIGIEWVTYENSDSVITNGNGNGKTILICHDSYMDQMKKYIGKEYSYSSFIYKKFAITEEDILNQTPDVVVFELLERMLNNYTDELSYWQQYS